MGHSVDVLVNKMSKWQVVQVTAFLERTTRRNVARCSGRLASYQTTSRPSYFGPDKSVNGVMHFDSLCVVNVFLARGKHAGITSRIYCVAVEILLIVSFAES